MNVSHRARSININKIIPMDDMIITCVIYIYIYTPIRTIRGVHYMYHIKAYQTLNSICMYS